MWNGTPSTVAGVSWAATAARIASPLSRSGGTSSTPGVQAVEQAADQAEHVHHRGQQDDPLAGQRAPRRSGCSGRTSATRSAAVRPITFDGPVEPELSWITACAVPAGRSE